MFLSVLLLTVAASAQQPPAPVLEAFDARYPDAEGVGWMEDEMGFAADFETTNGYVTAWFAASGKWVQTHTSLNQQFWPVAVTGSVTKRFGGPAIDDITLIEAAGTKVYEVSYLDEYDEFQYVRVGGDGAIPPAAGAIELDSDFDEEEDEEE